MKNDLMRYKLTEEQKDAVLEYFKGKYTLRELGEILGLSHQGAKDMIPKYIKDSVIDGELIITKVKGGEN